MSPDASPAAAAEAASARQATLRHLAYAQAWNDALPPELAAFREWTQRHGAATGATRSALEAEGVELARVRRAVMLELIVSDPQRALALTVPAVIRQQLPPAVLAELETRVAGRGDFALVGASPAIGEPAPVAMRRIAVIGRATYTAHVYGRREPQTAKEGISLHGIVLDRQLALHESPVRALEPGEIPSGAASPNCPVSDLPVDTQVADPSATTAKLDVAEADGRIWQFCSGSDDMLGRFAQMLEAGEDSAGRGAGTPPTAGEATTPWSVGTKQVLVIRVDFSDFPGEPMTQQAAQTVMNSVNNLYQEMSYGQTSITATVSNNVYRLPTTGTTYAVNDNEGQMHTDARTAAAADYTVTSYDRVIVLFRNLGTSVVTGSKITFGGEANILGPNVWINGSSAFVLPTVSHELGHTYGLAHANLWRVSDGNPLSASGNSYEYGDPFDTMGSSSVTGVTRDSRHHFNPWHKNRLGWLPDSAVTTVKTSGTYRIYRFDHKDSPRQLPLAIRIYRDGVRNYWIGLRQNFASGTPASNDAYVIWGYNQRQQSALLDLTTPGVSVSSAAASSGIDAALPIGTTFSDAAYGITIKPVGRGGSEPEQYLDVEITVGPAGPPNVVTGWGRDGAYFFDSNNAGVATSPVPETNVPMGLSGVRAIAGGERHVVALKSDGTVVAWGNNTGGQSTVPSGLASVIAIAAGGNVSGAIQSDGTLIMWGDNAFGQTTVSAGLVNVRQLAIGRNHVLALKVDGTVVAWGGNAQGQSTVPAGLADVIAVAAGTELSVVLKRDGTVANWGSTFGRPPTGTTGLVAIAAAGVLNGGQFVSGLKADGTVVAWGANNSNQTGVPAGLNNVVAIAAGAFHTLCLKADGSVVAFGSDTSGKLSVPTNMPRSYAVTATNAASFALSGPGPGLYITTQPAAQTIATGAPATLSVAATGTGTLTYQWRKDGVAIPGATASTYTIPSATAASAGVYDVIVRDGTSSQTTFGARLLVSSAPGQEVSRIANLSILTNIATSGDSFTMGYVVGGAGTGGAKPLVIRAVGPSLGALGVPGTLVDPRLELYAGATKTGENDNWAGASNVLTAMAAVGAFPFTGPTSRDAALVANITTRDNSVKVAATGTGTGAVIAEIYDATPSATFNSATPRLLNVSVLKNIGTSLTAGFVISGPTAKTVLIRAIGPTLNTAFGIPGVVSNPQLVLFGRNQTRVGENDNWGGTAALTAAFTSVGAFTLPAASQDAALVVTLTPGDYSVVVTGVGNTTGLALVEVYDVP